MRVQAKRMILHILVFLVDVELCYKGNMGMAEDCEEEDILEESLFEKHFNFTHILLCYTTCSCYTVLCGTLIRIICREKVLRSPA